MRFAELMWAIFKRTGSIEAYLLYKKYKLNQEIINDGESRLLCTYREDLS